jgi:two-component system response regulator NreC
LDQETDVQVVASAMDGRQAVQLAQNLEPDVAIVDFSLPPLGGVAATQELRHTVPSVQIVVLSRQDSIPYLERALRSGARGFVLTLDWKTELAVAARVVAGQQNYMSPAMTSLLVRKHFGGAGEFGDPSPQLSFREEEVLRLLARGLGNAQIARELGLSIKTVQSHRSNILAKLELHNNDELIQYALQTGLVLEEETATGTPPQDMDV